MVRHLATWINHLFPQLRKDYERLLFKHEFLIDKKASTKTQIDAYTQNLSAFLVMLKKIVESIEKKNILAILETIVYNRKLRENQSKTMKKYEKEDSDLSKIKEIDELLEKEVNNELQKIEKNAKEQRK